MATNAGDKNFRKKLPLPMFIFASCSLCPMTLCGLSVRAAWIVVQFVKSWAALLTGVGLGVYESREQGQGLVDFRLKI